MNPPPSLRVYLLSKALHGPIVDVLGADYSLMRELECIAAAENAAKARSARQQQRKNKRR